MSKRCEWVGKFGLRRSQFELVDDISSVANLGRRRKRENDTMVEKKIKGPQVRLLTTIRLTVHWNRVLDNNLESAAGPRR